MNRTHLRYTTTIALAAGLLGLTACHDSDAASANAAEEMAVAQKDSARMKNELNLLREDFDKKYGEVQHQNEELLKANDDLRKQLEQAQDQIDKTKKELEDHMAKYRVGVRARAKGFELPHLETADHQAFDSVVVTAVTPTEVKFAHSNGISTVLLEKLPPALQERFGYDAAEVKQMAAASAAAAQAAAEAAEHPAPNPKDAPGTPKILTVAPGTADPVAINRLQQRIATREAEIKSIAKEAEAVKASRYGVTSLGRVRLEFLDKRVALLKSEIEDLKYMLERVMNG